MDLRTREAVPVPPLDARRPPACLGRAVGGGCGASAPACPPPPVERAPRFLPDPRPTFLFSLPSRPRPSGPLAFLDSGWGREPATKVDTGIRLSGRFSGESAVRGAACRHFCSLEARPVALGVVQARSVQSGNRSTQTWLCRRRRLTHLSRRC